MKEELRWMKKAADEEKRRRRAEQELESFRQGVEAIGMAVDAVLIRVTLSCGKQDGEKLYLHLPGADKALLQQYKLDVEREENGCRLTITRKS